MWSKTSKSCDYEPTRLNHGRSTVEKTQKKAGILVLKRPQLEDADVLVKLRSWDWVHLHGPIKVGRLTTSRLEGLHFRFLASLSPDSINKLRCGKTT
jgi:hypothetical protein